MLKVPSMLRLIRARILRWSLATNPPVSQSHHEPRATAYTPGRSRFHDKLGSVRLYSFSGAAAQCFQSPLRTSYKHPFLGNSHSTRVSGSLPTCQHRTEAFDHIG